MSRKRRKAKPSVPRYYYYNDQCILCKKIHGCGNCKFNKFFVKDQEKKRRRAAKNAIRNKRYDEC